MRRGVQLPPCWKRCRSAVSLVLFVRASLRVVATTTGPGLSDLAAVTDVIGSGAGPYMSEGGKKAFVVRALYRLKNCGIWVSSLASPTLICG